MLFRSVEAADTASTMTADEEPVTTSQTQTTTTVITAATDSLAAPSAPAVGSAPAGSQAPRSTPQSTQPTGVHQPLFTVNLGDPASTSTPVKAAPPPRLPGKHYDLLDVSSGSAFFGSDLGHGAGQRDSREIETSTEELEHTDSTLTPGQDQSQAASKDAESQKVEATERDVEERPLESGPEPQTQEPLSHTDAEPEPQESEVDSRLEAEPDRQDPETDPEHESDSEPKGVDVQDQVEAETDQREADVQPEPQSESSPQVEETQPTVSTGPDPEEPNPQLTTQEPQDDKPQEPQDDKPREPTDIEEADREIDQAIENIRQSLEGERQDVGADETKSAPQSRASSHGTGPQASGQAQSTPRTPSSRTRSEVDIFGDFDMGGFNYYVETGPAGAYRQTVADARLQHYLDDTEPEKVIARMRKLFNLPESRQVMPLHPTIKSAIETAEKGRKTGLSRHRQGVPETVTWPTSARMAQMYMDDSHAVQVRPPPLAAAHPADTASNVHPSTLLPVAYSALNGQEDLARLNLHDQSIAMYAQSFLARTLNRVSQRAGLSKEEQTEVDAIIKEAEDAQARAATSSVEGMMAAGYHRRLALIRGMNEAHMREVLARPIAESTNANGFTANEEESFLPPSRSAPSRENLPCERKLLKRRARKFRCRRKIVKRKAAKDK